jgi:hypothetical protein
MNNKEINNIPVIVKKPNKPKRKSLEDLPDERYQKLQIINPYDYYNPNLAEDCNGMYIQGYITGINQARRFTSRRIKSPLNRPGLDFLGNWKEDMVSSKKEHFIVGFTTAFIHALSL